MAAGLLAELRGVASEPGPRPARARRAAEAIRRHGGYRWVGLYDVSPELIAAVAWTGPNPPSQPTFPAARGLCGAVVASRRTVVVGDVTKDPRYLTTFGTTRSEIVVPVIRDGRAVGLIDVESEKLHAFGEADRMHLEECARALAILWSTDVARSGP